MAQRLVEYRDPFLHEMTAEDIVESLLVEDMQTLEALEEGMLQHGWVKFKAIVKKLMPDIYSKISNAKHQRFIVQMGERPGSPNIEVDHSLDAAPRAPVQPGDKIQIRGLLEPRGGDGNKPIVHFTHTARDGSPAGFIWKGETPPVWTVK